MLFRSNLLSPILDFDHKDASQSCPGTLAQIAEIIDSQYTKLDDMDSGYKCYEASSLDSDDGTYKIATRYGIYALLLPTVYPKHLPTHNKIPQR